MIKCITCVNRTQTGKKQTCKMCKTKIIIGEMNEPFIEHCKFYEPNDLEKKASRNKKRN